MLCTVASLVIWLGKRHRLLCSPSSLVLIRAFMVNVWMLPKVEGKRSRGLRSIEDMPRLVFSTMEEPVDSKDY